MPNSMECGVMDASRKLTQILIKPIILLMAIYQSCYNILLGEQAEAQNKVLYHFVTFRLCQKLLKKLKWSLKAFFSDTSCFA